MDTAQQIIDLIEPFVKQGKILHRSYAQIKDNIGDFVVLREGKVVIACAGLKDCQDGNMGEIYALAVAEKAQNQGVSLALMSKIMQKAHTDNFAKIFALSKHNSQWFLKQGFTQMPIDKLPKKNQKNFNHQRNSFIFFKEIKGAN
ncbi:MAG: GNAT family N-acetyltransferase [Candidatus Thioglobus sp.]|nr:MAG: GNAT family N-acetyltransferase [Candidatus Thioglobus sp.]KAA0456389.1 MAG: GNAT family N-acetyltransferase [Candidatus Thioglobus sp.]